MRDHIINEVKTKKTHGEDYKEKPTFLKKTIKHKDSESKIRTCNDTSLHWYSKSTRGKCLGNWRGKNHHNVELLPLITLPEEIN